jgi:hypothetical protein
VSSGLPEVITLFLDRTHESRLMVRMLRGIDAHIQCHGTYFRQDEDDHIWIPTVAQKGWAIITGDKGIENDGINRQSVIDAKAKVFLLDDSNSRGAEWAASLVLAHRRIMRIAERNNGPFYCTIRKGSDAHVDESDIRYHAGGGPIEPPQSAELSPAQERLNFDV